MDSKNVLLNNFSTSCDTIMKFIWKRLDSDNREWRRILKV